MRLMNRQEAIVIIEQGITYRQLRGILLPAVDGTESETIRDFTKLETHFLLRGCIANKDGRVQLKSHDALVAQLVLREFVPDR
jgi:N-acetylglutamate synthase-like GNAT family acetyltransferase